MRRQSLFLGLSLAALLVLTVRAGAGMEPGLDYFADASSAIDALARGDWTGFTANQPLMGSFSLLARAPFVALVFEHSLDVVYFAGALPCLIATALLGLILARGLAERGHSTAVQGLVAGLAVINPLTFRALHWGHPEELLAGALCVGAVLAALRDRELLAAVLLGLALATKQWALIAVLPTLLAASQRRLPILGGAVLIASALTLPMMLAQPEQFESVARSATGQDSLGVSTTPWNVWWPLATLELVPPFEMERWMAPGWVAKLSHPLIVAIAAPLSGLLWLKRGRRRDDALLLLALLFLLRCVLDNWNNDYYHVPFFLSLLAWETVRRPGVPRLSLAVLILLGLSFWPNQTQIFAGSVEDAPLLFGAYIAWTLPLVAALAAELYFPAGVRRVVDRVRVVARRPTRTHLDAQHR